MLDGDIGESREHRSNNVQQQPMPWDGVDRRGQAYGNGDWSQYRYLFLEKFNVLERKVSDIEETVDDIKLSFVKLQTKILVVSSISGIVSAALMAAIFTALADKFIK